MPVVTITGQIGSGGREIGRELARLLKAHYVDQGILSEAARRTGIGLAEWTKADERTDSLQTRIARGLERFLARASASSIEDSFHSFGVVNALLSHSYEEASRIATNNDDQLRDRRFLEITTDVIKDLADEGNVIIIGRGAPIILKDHPDALHVLTLAPEDYRVDHIMQRERVDRPSARSYLHKHENDRLSYLRKFFNIDAYDQQLYDIVLSTQKFPFSEAARILAQAAESVQGQQPRRQVP